MKLRMAEGFICNSCEGELAFALAIAVEGNEEKRRAEMQAGEECC